MKRKPIQWLGLTGLLALLSYAAAVLFAPYGVCSVVCAACVWQTGDGFVSGRRHRTVPCLPAPND